MRRLPSDSTQTILQQFMSGGTRERSEKIKKMKARFAKKYQSLGKAEDK